MAKKTIKKVAKTKKVSNKTYSGNMTQCDALIKGSYKVKLTTIETKFYKSKEDALKALKDHKEQ